MKFSSQNSASTPCKISVIHEFSGKSSLDCLLPFLTSSRLIFIHHFSSYFFQLILSNFNDYYLPHLSTLFLSSEQSEINFFSHQNDMKNLFSEHFRGNLAIYPTIFGDFLPFSTTQSSNQKLPSPNDSLSKDSTLFYVGQTLYFFWMLIDIYSVQFCLVLLSFARSATNQYNTTSPLF